MARMLPRTCIVIVLLSSFSIPFLSPLVWASSFNLTLPHQHPYPEDIAQEIHRRVNVSLSRRQTLETQRKDQFSCVTGNPIDDCWRCDPNWGNNRQQLADCAIGFGHKSFGGKGGPIYVVTNPSDPDPDKPKPGSLRDAVSQPGPVWIIFSGDMVIKLKRPLMVSSFKTIDGRGAHVEITGGGCISIEHVTNVIIHNINIHHCYPAAYSDGDGLHIFASSNIWVDHCSLSNCADGLIDCTEGSTAITISNCYFSHHDKVMLLGHSDDYPADRGMQVTVAFNRFGEALVQRMPRCRFGYFHVVNNDYKSWGEYAVGGSSNPTINSQGNRYIAPSNPNTKEVTRRLDTKGNEWKGWNWRTEGDLMVNGAFFVPSGDGVNAQYALASSVDPKSSAFIDQLTLNAGVLLANGGMGIANPGSRSGGISPGGGYTPGGGGGAIPGGMYGYAPPGFGGEGGYDGDGYGGFIFSNAPPPPSYTTLIILSSTLIIFTFYLSRNHYLC